MKRSTRVAIFIAFLCAALYAAYGFITPGVWNSPDETAAAYFSRIFGSTGRLWELEPHNIFADDLVHPRSVLSIGAYLVPGSFYGSMWIFGVVFKLIGEPAFAVVTPFMTALAGIVVFVFLRRIFDTTGAFIGQMLFLLHPAVWYLGSRGLFPNLLFIDLVILGLGVLLLRPWAVLTTTFQKPLTLFGALIDDVLGTLIIALAVSVRAVELIWLAPLLLIILWMHRKGITLVRIIAVVLAAGSVLIAVLITNQSLYEGLAVTGYTAGATQPGISVPALEQGSRLPASVSAPKPYILPFGFHPRTAFINVWNYVVWFIPWLALAGLIGAITWKGSPWRRRFLITLGGMGGVLGMYYGSGVFVDVIHTDLTIGSSYVRYFLPISLLLIPFTVQGIQWLSKKFLTRFPLAGIGGLLVVFTVFSSWTVLYRSPESLVPAYHTLTRYAEIKKAVLELTAQKDVIVVERSDKIFFPDRKVVLNLRSPATLDVLPKLAKLGQVYYYGITIADAELPELNRLLGQNKLKLSHIRSFENESLYRISP